MCRHHEDKCKTGQAMSAGSWAPGLAVVGRPEHESNSLRARRSHESSPLAALFWRTLAGLRTMIRLTHASHKSTCLLKEMCTCLCRIQRPTMSSSGPAQASRRASKQIICPVVVGGGVELRHSLFRHGSSKDPWWITHRSFRKSSLSGSAWWTAALARIAHSSSGFWREALDGISGLGQDQLVDQLLHRTS